MPNGTPATQRELLEAQLEQQAMLYDMAGRIEAKVNDGFDKVREDIAALSTRVTLIEGISEGETKGEKQKEYDTKLWTMGLIVSFLTAVASLAVSLIPH